MALITTQKAGKPLYIVRWNYRDKAIDGKPYDEKSFRNHAQAVAWEKKVGKAPGQSAGKARWSTIIDEWLEEHVSTLDAGTIKDYEGVARIHMKPGFGSKVADRFTPKDASHFVKTLHRVGFAHLDKHGNRQPAQPVKAPTVNKVLRITRAMVRWARAEGRTTCTAFQDTRGIRDVRPREERRARAYAYSHAERAAIVAGCPTMLLATMVRVGADCGLRRGELLALKWENVDLDDGLIHVRDALDAHGNRKDPKAHEYRTVPILDDGWEALLEWHEQAPDTELVFPARDGGNLHTKLKTMIGVVRQACGIHLQMHELRDTYASALIASGAKDVELTIALGHRTVQTTRDHYAEWLGPSRELIRERANAHQRLTSLREAVRANA